MAGYSRAQAKMIAPHYVPGEESLSYDQILGWHQRATKPAEVLCLLSGQNFALKGHGEIADSQQKQRYRQFAAMGIAVPEVYTSGIIESQGSVELTAWQAAFWLALSRLSASPLPEVVGFHYAYYSLGFDDVLLGLPAPVAKTQLETLMATFSRHCKKDEQGAASEKRMLNAIAWAVPLEMENSEMLLVLQSLLEHRTPDDRMAEIVLCHASRRKIYQGRLIDLQLVKPALAKMEITLSVATLMIAHAAWQMDKGEASFGKSSAMAKHFATEQACRIVDDALQMLGATGVVADSQIAQLYRQIRPLRIYEGASDALLMNIASALDSHRLQQREDLQ